MKGTVVWLLVLTIVTALAAGCRSGSVAREERRTLRLGYLANLTHAQALIGVADGSFAKAAGVPVETKVFSAGPSAITALLADEIDMLYVGPSPAVNGYVRSSGKALRVLAGGTSGGASFVVQPQFDPAHMAHARLASPGVANTQDVSLRHYLTSRGLKTMEQGGSVRVLPTAPADILALFGRKQIDGAWVAEPWAARLEVEFGAQLAWDERDLWPERRFATTVLVVATPYLEQHRDVVQAIVKRHVEITRFIQDRPQEAAKQVQQALGALQGKPIPDRILQRAWGRLDFITDPMEQSVSEQARRAFQLGFLGARQPDLSDLYDLSVLKEVAP